MGRPQRQEILIEPQRQEFLLLADGRKVIEKPEARQRRIGRRRPLRRDERHWGT